MDDTFIRSIEDAPKNIFYDLLQSIGRPPSVVSRIYVMANMPRWAQDKLGLHLVIASAVCAQKRRLVEERGSAWVNIPTAVASYSSSERFQKGVFSQPEQDFFKLLDEESIEDAYALELLSKILSRCITDKKKLNFSQIYSDTVNWNKERRSKWESEYAREIIKNKGEE